MVHRAYALIPARSGSKGLPHKNIIEINGHPLIAYSIAFARKLAVDRVLVSTDAEAYRRIALKYGAECPFLRSDEASSDSAREEDILADLAVKLPAHGMSPPDIWIWLKPVNPFRNIEAVASAQKLLAENDEIDSVRLVSESDARIHRINERGFLEPYGAGWNLRVSKMPRTGFPKVYQPYNLEIFRHDGWRKWGARFMGDRIVPIAQPKITGIDIDDRDTFEIARALIEAKPRPEIVARHICL